MHTESSPERLALLSFKDEEIGQPIMFCPKCDFQGPPGATIPNRCPRCTNPYLHIVTIDQELIYLTSSRRMQDRKPKYKCVYVDPTIVINLMNYGLKKEFLEFVKVPIIVEELPEDVQIVNIDWSPDHIQFRITLFSNTFPIVPYGETIPCLHSRVYIAEKPVKKVDHE